MRHCTTAQRFPVAHAAYQLARHLRRIAEKYVVGFNRVVAAIVVIVSGGGADLHAGKKVSQLQCEKLHCLSHKGGIMLLAGIVSGGATRIGKSVCQQIAPSASRTPDAATSSEIAPSPTSVATSSYLT